MTTFDKREEGFEKKFAHDEELQVQGDRPAQQAARACGPPEKLGITGADADAYAKEVVMADFEEAGDARRFHASCARISTARAHRADRSARTMNELLAQAIAQIKAERLTWPLSPSPARCAPAKPSTAAGARSARRSSPRAIGARRLFRRQPRSAARPVGHRRDPSPASPRSRQAGAAPVVRVPLEDFALASRALDCRRRSHHRADDQQRRRRASASSRQRNIRRSASAAGARTARMTLQGRSRPTTICARPTTAR